MQPALPPDCALSPQIPLQGVGHQVGKSSVAVINWSGHFRNVRALLGESYSLTSASIYFRSSGLAMASTLLRRTSATILMTGASGRPRVRRLRPPHHPRAQGAPPRRGRSRPCGSGRAGLYNPARGHHPSSPAPPSKTPPPSPRRHAPARTRGRGIGCPAEHRPCFQGHQLPDNRHVLVDHDGRGIRHRNDRTIAIPAG